MIVGTKSKSKLTQIKVQSFALFSKFVGKPNYIVTKQKYTPIKT